MFDKGGGGNYYLGHLVKLFTTSWNSLPVSQEYIALRTGTKLFS